MPRSICPAHAPGTVLVRRRAFGVGGDARRSVESPTRMGKARGRPATNHATRRTRAIPRGFAGTEERRLSRILVASEIPQRRADLQDGDGEESSSELVL